MPVLLLQSNLTIKSCLTERLLIGFSDASLLRLTVFDHPVTAIPQIAPLLVLYATIFNRLGGNIPTATVPMAVVSRQPKLVFLPAQSPRHWPDCRTRVPQ